MRAMETPPHAWGRRACSPSPRVVKRNTPTCVGKTPFPLMPGDFGKKHPHMRGEDFYGLRSGIRYDGNTPTCVGKTILPFLKSPFDRNTPTCVGKT